MEHLIEKAAVLHEALPYIREFSGQLFVVKYGGHAMIKPALRDSFARDIVLMKYVGLNPIVVHGGGPQVDEKLAALGLATTRVDGLRVTNDQTMEVVEMVLGGTVNQEIVSLICGHGGRAVGLTGRDDGFMKASPMGPVRTRSGKEVDLERVGRIDKIDPEIVRRLVDDQFIPVIAPIALGPRGRSLNVNADTVAGAVAAAIGARKLVLMTDTEGVRDESGEVASSLGLESIRQLIDDGIIEGGMIPKVECGLRALKDGVRKVHILDGRRQHAVMLELFTDRGIGTEITKS